MSTLSDRLYAHARITPVRKPNQIKAVEKLEGGALRVQTHGGDSYDIPADAMDLQAFAIWTVLNDAARA